MDAAVVEDLLLDTVRPPSAVKPTTSPTTLFLCLLPVTFAYFMVLFGIFPISIQVLIATVCDEMNDDDCESADVASRVSTINMYITIATYVPSICMAGVYANVADHYGRKLTIFIPLLGLLIYSVCYTIVSLYHPTYYLYIILLGAICLGISGSYSTFIMAVFSSMSDFTSPSDRRLSYSIAETVIVLAKVLGPIGGGIWASMQGFNIPLIGFVGIGLAGCLWLLVMVEETLLVKLSLQINPWQTYSNIRLLFSTQPNAGKSILPLLCSAFLLYFICINGEAYIFFIYTKHRFGWGADLMGYFDGISAAIIAFSMSLLPPLVEKVTHVESIAWIHIGLTTRAVFFTMLGLVTNTISIFLLLLLLLPAGPIAPYTRTMLSNSVPLHMQSSIFSAFSALESMCTLMTPIFLAGYSAAVQMGLDWSIFVAMGGLCVISVVVVAYLRLNKEYAVNIPCDRMGGSVQYEKLAEDPPERCSIVSHDSSP